MNKYKCLCFLSFFTFVFISCASSPRTNTIIYKDFELVGMNKNKYWKIIDYKGSLSEITIPHSIKGRIVRAIGKKAFYQKGITSVIFETGVNIEEEAFANNPLSTIIFNMPFSSLEKDAFPNQISLLYQMEYKYQLLWKKSYKNDYYIGKLIYDLKDKAITGKFIYIENEWESQEGSWKDNISILVTKSTSDGNNFYISEIDGNKKYGNGIIRESVAIIGDQHNILLSGKHTLKLRVLEHLGYYGDRKYSEITITYDFKPGKKYISTAENVNGIRQLILNEEGDI